MCVTNQQLAPGSDGTTQVLRQNPDGSREWTTLGELTVLTADPASPADDTWWMRRTGSSPAMEVEVRARIAGVTYTVAGITI